MNKERYTKQVILKKSFEIIEAHNIIHITTLIAYLKISKDTFYRKIKVGSKDYERILEAIEDNKAYQSGYALDKLKELVDKCNLRAIETWLKIFGSDKVREALSNNYNVNAKATIDSEKERQKEIERVENNFNKLTAEEKKQFQRIMAKLHSN